MDKDVPEDATQMEINICNTDSSSGVVLNDLKLLELLYSYPFLLSKAVVAHGDKDYEEWAWTQIVKEFNESYVGLELNTPFTIEELQWRWEILRPICPSLGKACGQIPDTLWYVICKINRLMSNKTPARVKQLSPAQQLIMSQLPLMERLTESQQKQLEVEVLDAILSHERSLYLAPLTPKVEDIVQSQYKDFLKALRIKELPTHLVPKYDKPEGNLTPTESINSSDSNPGTTRELPNSAGQKKASSSNLVISNVCRLAESEDEEVAASSATPQMEFKAEPYQLTTVPTYLAEESESSDTVVPPRYVPLKSAKYYTKKLRIRVKRIHLDEYISLAKIKRSKHV